MLSSSGTLPAGCQLLATAGTAPVIVATLPGRGEDARRQGCEVLELPAQNGRPAVAELLRELGRRRMTNVLVEGGAAVLGSFHDAGLVDELHVFMAPKLIGGTAALSPVGGLGLGFVGMGGLVSGCWNLLRATRLSLVNIQEEAALIREQQAQLRKKLGLPPGN